MRPPHADRFRRRSEGNATRRCTALLACIGAALLLGAVARSAATPAPSFAAPTRYAVDDSPGPLAIADLNGDGKPELVVGSGDSDALSVLVNRGDGSFEARRDYGSPRAPDSLAIADLNGDGRRDLAAAYHSGTVSVLLNSGDGSFEARSDYSVGRGAYSLALADLNGDGKPDLTTANAEEGTGSVSVLLNRGDGSFATNVDYTTGREPDSLAIGDVSGDGKPDLVTANAGADTVSLLVGHGDGSFEPRRDYATRVGPPAFLTLADLNGDGKPDLLFAGEDPDSNSVSVWLNNGDGSFRHERLPTCFPCFDTSMTEAVGGLAIADLNGDGRLDVVSRNLDEVCVTEPGCYTELAGSVSVFLNKGDGTFRRQRGYPTGFAEGGSFAATDLNGDQRPEIIVAEGRVTVLANRGDGSLRPKLEYPGSSGLFKDLATGDLNADGKADLVTIISGRKRGPSGSVRVLLNTPGLCNVQGVVGGTTAAAKRKLARVNCRVGKIGRAYSKRVKKGRVISQKPRFGAVLPGGGRVNLVVSRGRKH